MKITNFDGKNMFNKALKDGLNIFCGAGFSVLARNYNDDELMLGDQLLEKLKNKFDVISGYKKLAKACAKLEGVDEIGLRNFMTEQYTVKNYDPKYNILTRINLKNIYTTNIDDLWFNIFPKSNTKYINDASIRGRDVVNKNIINYCPLHGCVRNDDPYIFSSIGITKAFIDNNENESWRRLAEDAGREPILFWGWNFEDDGPIQAMYSGKSEIGNNIKKWILLFNPSEEDKDYLKNTLGFNLIIGDTESLLDYINQCVSSDPCLEESDDRLDDTALKKYLPPSLDEIGKYPLVNMFSEYATNWSHVYGNELHKTLHYKKIAEEIYSGNNVIVYGIRGSGKTTLKMQLLSDLDIDKTKHYMNSPTYEEAKSYVDLICGRKVILFIDDCFRDTNALVELLKHNNIQVVAFDRDFSFEGQFSKVEEYIRSCPIDVTEITQEDAQAIIKTIPNQYRNRNYRMEYYNKDKTIPAILASSLYKIQINFIENFYRHDNIAAEVFLVICYVHSCGVPCSFDMIYSYLSDKNNYSWRERIDIVKRIGKLVKEWDKNVDIYDIDICSQDYYECRSRIFAERILDSSKKSDKILSSVLMKFAVNVPLYKICGYDKFKRCGYDADLAFKAFPIVEDGEKFYKICKEKDDSEYIYQQAALYFYKKKDYDKAFRWIEKAKNMPLRDRYSINNTYAIIYFGVNLYSDKILAKEALAIMDDCCQNDRRKFIHLLTYALSVEKFIKKYGSTDNYDVIGKALAYAEEGISDANYSLSSRNKRKLRDVYNRLKIYQIK